MVTPIPDKQTQLLIEGLSQVKFAKENRIFTIPNLLAKAANGDIDAMKKLSSIYLEGYGVKKDLQKSFEFALKAAKAGDVDALFFIGKVLMKGEFDVPKNPEVAFDCLSEASSLGHFEAKKLVASMLYSGIGTKKNPQKASELFYQIAMQRS